MKKIVVAAMCMAVSSTPAFGQSSANSTAVGTGIAASKSQSTAVAVSGQGGKGVGVGTGGNPTSNVTIQGTQIPTATTSTVNNEGTSTVKNVPSVFAPGLAAAGLETCLGSVSGGGSFVGTGFSFGSTIPDPGCAARLDARTLWSFGLKKAAVARLCEGTDIARAMPEVCGQYLPGSVPAVAVAAPVGYGARVQPTSYYYDDVDTYRSGPIMLVDGKTGADRLCNSYDKAHRRCRLWDGVVSSKPKRVVRTAKSEVKTPAAPPPAVVEAKPADPQPVDPKPASSLQAPVPSAFKLVNEPAKGGPSIERREVKNEDETVARCLGFCAASR